MRPLIDLEKQKKAKDIVTIETPGTVKLPSTADSGEAQTFLYDRYSHRLLASTVHAHYAMYQLRCWCAL